MNALSCSSSVAPALYPNIPSLQRQCATLIYKRVLSGSLQKGELPARCLRVFTASMSLQELLSFGALSRRKDWFRKEERLAIQRQIERFVEAAHTQPSLQRSLSRLAGLLGSDPLHVDFKRLQRTRCLRAAAPIAQLAVPCFPFYTPGQGNSRRKLAYKFAMTYIVAVAANFWITMFTMALCKPCEREAVRLLRTYMHQSESFLWVFILGAAYLLTGMIHLCMHPFLRQRNGLPSLPALARFFLVSAHSSPSWPRSALQNDIRRFVAEVEAAVCLPEVRLDLFEPGEEAPLLPFES